MLNDSTVIAMVAVKDIESAKQFYGDTLGLKQGDENKAGVTYESGAGRLFVYAAPTAGTNQGTSATWEVSDINGAVNELRTKGIVFEHYEFPDAEHENDGAIHKMFGTKGAWFKDPDGNILGLSEVK